MAVRPIPEGFHTLTPYLTVHGVAKLIDFLKKAFGAEELERFALPDGRIMHAMVRIGDSIVMMGEQMPGGATMPAQLYMYVEDTDATYARAMKAGGVSIQEPADMFYGDRNAGVSDHCGNKWWIATHVEDMTQEELMRRAQLAKKPAG